jgi:hypothetical protein
MASQQNTIIPENTQQCRVILIPDFTETQSVAMIKVHHCVGDGMALIIMIGLL